VPLPVFVLIDELDRCRPPYAIAMLERIKHLFEIPDVVFVVATDSEQLVHSIRAVYGQDFSGSRYLTRFFDLSYTFPAPKTLGLVRSFLNEMPRANLLRSPFNIEPAELAADFFDTCNVDPRSILRALERIRAIVVTWDIDIPLELAVLLPLVVASDDNSRVLEMSLKNLFENLRSKFALWRIGYHNESQGGFSMVDGMDLLNEFFSKGRDLKELGERRRPNDQPGRYVHAVLSEEFMKLRGSRSYAGEVVPSIILNYQGMVRRAGQLSVPKAQP